MNKAFFLFFITLVSSQSALAGIELLGGANIGTLSFDGINNSFESVPRGLHLSARGTYTTGRIQIGVGVSRGSSTATLNADSGDDSEIKYDHLYYGPVLAYLISAKLRLDFEYYTDSTIKLNRVQEQANSTFSKGDQVFGRGFGAGVSFLRGHFISQLLYQRFSSRRVEIDGEEFGADSDEFSQFLVQNIVLRFGILF